MKFPIRKTLVVAIAGIGLWGGAQLQEARPEAVFVPELQWLDGALCLPPAGKGSAFSILRTAQAAGQPERRKKGISPASTEAARAASGPAPSDEPPLMQGLGNTTLPVSTASAEARRYFTQGYRLAWGFNHAEALRAFRKAQRLDPQCAMCYWAEAWALGPNINVPMEPEANAPALAAVQSARRHAAQASPREQALIAAMAARYSGAAQAGRATLDQAYADAMRDVAKRFPEDAEIAVLYADALMNVSAWDYWEADKKTPRPAVAELVPTLERVLEKHPEHAAAIHLYIHAVEASANPRRAERYADRLAALAPNAGHLVHMPAHIYFVIGRYKDSLATNLKAVKADEAYIAAEKPAGVYPLGYYPHNVHFVMVSAQMGGDGAQVVAAAKKLGALIPAEAARAVPLMQPIKAAPYYAHADFSPPETVLALEDPGDIPYVRTAWHYARGVVLARAGDLAQARSELAAIEKILGETDYAPFAAWKIPAQEVATIASHVLRARIAQAQGDLAQAVRHIEAALPIEASLPYMEPAYWYYPLRQTLGALRLAQGDTAGAREAFGASLVRAPNNAWALYGLAQAYARDGKRAEAKAVEKRFTAAWMGKRDPIDLARL